MPIRKDLSVGSIERAKQHRTGWVTRPRRSAEKPRSRTIARTRAIGHGIDYPVARAGRRALDEIGNVTKALG